MGKLKSISKWLLAAVVRMYAAIIKKDWFYLFLSLQVNDIDSAKKFYKKFEYDWGQYIPFIGLMGLRSMCYHLSMILEGYEQDPNDDKVLTNYTETKYGSEIYFS